MQFGITIPGSIWVQRTCHQFSYALKVFLRMSQKVWFQIVKCNPFVITCYRIVSCIEYSELRQIQTKIPTIFVVTVAKRSSSAYRKQAEVTYFLQILHWNGFSPVCFRMCVLRCDVLLNLRLHSVQAYGLCVAVVLESCFCPDCFVESSSVKKVNFCGAAIFSGLWSKIFAWMMVGILDDLSFNGIFSFGSFSDLMVSDWTVIAPTPESADSGGHTAALPHSLGDKWKDLKQSELHYHLAKKAKNTQTR